MPKVESITEFFERDHREIDAVFEKLMFKDAKHDLPVFEEFDQRLERHINWEEEILFPAVGSVNPMIEQGPLRIMRIEHEAIRRSKANAKEALERGDLATAREHCEAVSATLGQHNMKEERILYPACDQSLDENAIANVFAKVKAGL